jgi:putative peptidoglycan lipid II flippase
MALIRNVFVVGAGTIAARLAGFGREVLIAAVLGASAVAEAYVAAFLLPNLFRRILGEGALNTAFVPIEARRRALGGVAGADAFARASMGAIALIALMLVVLGLVFMPNLMHAVAPGFAPGEARFADAVLFGRIALACAATAMIGAAYAALLFARGRFVGPSAAAPLQNAFVTLVLLAMAMAAMPADRSAGLAISLALAAGGLLQVGLLAASARRARAPALPASPFANGDVARMLLMLLPAAAVAGAGHLNMLVSAATASAHANAVAWLYYADRLFQLPVGFVSAAVGAVLLPLMARSLREGSREKARDAFSRALEFTLLLALPASASLYLLAEPIVDVVYRRGAFGAEDTVAVASLLRLLAPGLPALALAVVLLPAYAARETLKIPVLAVLAALSANLVVGAGFGERMGLAAAPLGVVAAVWVNVAVLAAGLAMKGDLSPDADARRRFFPLVLAALGTGAAVYGLRELLADALSPANTIALRFSALAAVCAAGVLAQAALALALRIVEAPGLAALARRKA